MIEQLVQLAGQRVKAEGACGITKDQEVEGILEAVAGSYSYIKEDSGRINMVWTNTVKKL